MDIEIKKCTNKDFGSVTRLLNQLWPDRKLDEIKLLKVYHKALRSKNQQYLKAVHKGKIIGFCSLSIFNTLYGNGESMHVDELVIDESFRSMGIGKMLLDVAKKISREKGCKMLELESATHRNDAHRFYENLGYEKMGVVFSLKLDK
jgi:ribosomal protein S18 acetylase RimI-like enzyme